MGYDESGYYSTRDIDGYGCKYRIVCTRRGPGKTFGMKRKLMKMDGKFLQIFRNEEDFKHSMRTWLDDLTLKGDARDNGFMYDPEELVIEKDRSSGELYYRGELKGYFRCLSASLHVKLETFADDTNVVWLDEMVPIGSWRKLAGAPREISLLLDIVKTVEHDSIHSREERGLKPVVVYCFCNPGDWSFPMLRDFGVNPVMGYGIHKGKTKNVVWEYLPPVTKGGERSAEDELGDSVDTNILRYEELADNVRQLPKGSRPLYSVRFGDEYFGVYKGSSGGYWICGKKGHVCERKYGSMKGLRADEQCCEDSLVIDNMKDMIMKQRFFYDSLNTKSAIVSCLLV